MTIKIVVDNTNVEEFPGANLSDVKEMMVRVAGLIEEGEFGNVENCVFVLDCEDGVHTFHWGKLETAIHALGILDLGKHHIMNQILGGPE